MEKIMKIIWTDIENEFFKECNSPYGYDIKKIDKLIEKIDFTNKCKNDRLVQCLLFGFHIEILEKILPLIKEQENENTDSI